MKAFLALSLLMPAQFGTLDAVSARAKQFVSYAAEQQVVLAGKRAVLELRFRVSDGFHVNSHTPKSKLLLRTQVQLDPAAGVKAGTIIYPPGKEYIFSFEPKEKLDVYTQEFVVSVPVEVARGTYVLKGSLQYQACDQALCYPPKSLPFEVAFKAQ